MGRKILFLSMNYPDPKATDAGTKSFAFYFSGLASDINNEIKLISLDNGKQKDGYGENVDFYPVKNEDNRFKRTVGYLRSIRSKTDPSYKYGNVMSLEKYRIIEGHLKKLIEADYKPDVVMFEWTYMLLFIDKVKKYFPEAKYVASEQDVTFQGMEREYQANKNRYNLTRYESMKQNELKCLNQCDLVFVYNNKDERLLEDNEIENAVVLSPFYEKRDYLYGQNKKNILFYGAMSRKENYSAAIWFINEVMPLLKDYDVRFVVAGNNPSKELVELNSDRVVVTGFVNDISELFSEAMCFVAPLIYGAGIKIKILEAMSAGIPVLTNNIGIEGIEGAEYYHCEKPEDYTDTIINIVEGKINCKTVSEQARKAIHNTFDYDKSLAVYKEEIYSLNN